MENKYYTPDITEFHVGFEYEVDYGSRWVKESLHAAPQVVTLPYMKLENIRVKYLDGEDIESLRFKQSNLSKNIFLYEYKISILPHLPKTTIGINFNEGINHILIFNVPDETKIPAGVNLFVGSIKNKSELKKLLKQLNINESN